MADASGSRMSLSTRIFIGLGLGIATGIFFGEEVAFLNVVGLGFIRLLQMPAIPFVVVSLIYGLGSLTYAQALSLAKKCGLVLGTLWAITIAAVTAIPLAFPGWESASFFSSALVEDERKIDFLSLYVPSNPFNSLASGVVPAVVLFCVVLGAVLIGVERKQVVLDLLSTLLQALSRVTGLIVRLAPIGVFAIAASAAGTLRVEELGRLQVYLLTYIAVALILSLWVLPVLVTTVTPLTYGEVVNTARSALVTAFATGNLLIVLPMIAQRAGDLLRRRELGTDESQSTIDVIVPTSYTFPSSGLLLSLAFVPFAAWYVGASLSVAQYPVFLVSGFFSFFGGTMVAIPFLLDMLRIPADMFDLFITIDVFTGRFGTLLAATHVWVLALLGATAVAGRIRIRWNKLIQFAATSLALCLAAVGAMYAMFTYGLDAEYTGYRSFVEMDLSTRDPVRATFQENPAPLDHDPARSRMDEIRERGFLRVGYTVDSLPFTFRNASNRLAGFDTDMAHLLAKDLGVGLEFVAIDRDNLIGQLEMCCDIFMSGYAVTAGRTEGAELSDTYMDTTLAFVVEDHRRDEFTSWEKIRRQDGLKIGLPGQTKYYDILLQRLVPDAELVRIDSPRSFFRDGFKKLDALAFVAEAGSAWTLVYPAFSVTVPMPNPIKIPLAYVVPKGSDELIAYVDRWIELKRKDGTLDALFRYWILGKGAERTEPRWSVARNVLGWFD